MSRYFGTGHVKQLAYKKLIPSKIMSRSISVVFEAARRVIGRFFESDMEVISREGREILSNPKDAKSYDDAIRRMKESKQPEKFTLENGETIQLIP